MTDWKRKIRITRFDRVVLGAGLLLVAAAGGLLWLSQMMVAPPRARLKDSVRPVIGITMRELEPSGLEIRRVAPPARDAGLRVGDRIVRIDDLREPSMQDLVRHVREAEAGHRFSIEAKRPAGDGESLVLVDLLADVRPVSPADEDLRYENVVFEGKGGLKLRGWYIPAPEGVGRAPAVAFGHGNAADRRQWLPAAAEIHEAGIAQLLFDFAGRGESDGEVISLGPHESEGLRTALDWLARRPDVDPQRLGLAGKSMGGAAAILAAADDPRVRVLVLDSPFADLRQTVDRAFEERHLPASIVTPLVFRIAGFRSNFDPDTVKPVEAMRRVKAPTLLLHGTADTVIPATDAEAIRDAAAGPVTYLPLEGIDHNDTRPPEVWDRVAAYLKGSLGR